MSKPQNPQEPKTVPTWALVGIILLVLAALLFMGYFLGPSLSLSFMR